MAECDNCGTCFDVTFWSGEDQEVGEYSEMLIDGFRPAYCPACGEERDG